MIFSRQAIKSAIEQGVVTIDPLDDADIEAAHINLHLGGLESGESTLVVAPREFVLAKTLEKITITEGYCGFMEGRAGLARQGISVEQSSTYIEPGSDNQMTLEISNASGTPVALEVGQPIAKLFLMKLVDTI